MLIWVTTFPAQGVHTNGVWSWGGYTPELGEFPPHLTNVVALSAGGARTLALRADGTVLSWGDSMPVPKAAVDVVAVEAGRSHNLALLGNGSVVAWGDNQYGQISVPSNLPPARAVTAGGEHCLVLLEDGSLVAWGDNSAGQLFVPTNLPPVKAIDAGIDHNLALLEDGTVVAWGRNRDGESTVPTGLSNVVAVAGGGRHSLALREDGTVVAWGADDHGQSTPPAGLSNVVAIAAGDDFSLALRADGSVVAWQEEFFGAVDVPAGLTNAVSISAGLTHSVALASDHPMGLVYPRDALVSVGSPWELKTAFVWRNPVSYQWYRNGLLMPEATNASLFLGSFDESSAGFYECIFSDAQGVQSVAATTVYLEAPWLIEAHPQDTRAGAGGTALFSVSVSSQALSPTFEWRLDGVTLLPGNGFAGITNMTLTVLNVQGLYMGSFDVMVRDGFRAAISAPAKLEVEPVVAWGDSSLVPRGLNNIVSIAADGALSLALDGQGRVWEWDGDEGVETGAARALDRVLSISAGAGHRLALRDDGSVVAWGDDSYGQSAVPAGLSNVTQVAAGGYHSMALRSDGTVIAWGADTSGGLKIPEGLSNVITIAAGWYHGLALKSDGTVVAWGADDAGQTEVPAGLSGVQRIAAGAFHNLALLSNGTVVAWGRAEEGQIAVPDGMAGVAGIAAGAYHSLAILHDGTVRAWGKNAEGQTTVPGPLTNVLSLAGGWAHTVALVSDHPVAQVYPFDPILESGSSVTLRVKATWLGPCTYQWLHQGSPVPGATNDWLTLTNVHLAGAGDYRCLVQGETGVTGQASTWVYVATPSLVLQPPTNQWVALGGNLQLTLSTACPGETLYQWRKDGVPLVNDDIYRGTRTRKLTLTEANLEQAGRYDVIIRCGVEAAISPAATLQVGRSVAVGWDASSTAGIAGYRVYWGERSREYSRIADVGLATNHVIRGLKEGTLYYLAVTAYDINLASSEFSEEVHYVTPGQPSVPLEPRIVQQPSDQVVGAGSRATFRVVAEGAGTLRFQWRKNGVNLSNTDRYQGVNQPELHIEQAGGEETGTYSVLVTNVINAAASSDALLRVYVQPALLPPITQPDGTWLLSIANSDGSPMTTFQAYRYWIQARSDMIQGAWSYLARPMTWEEGALIMRDPDSILMSQRFYRVVHIDQPAPRFQLQPPVPIAGGGMLIGIEHEDSWRPFSPTETERVTVEVSDNPMDPEGWSPLPGSINLMGERLVTEDLAAASFPIRFYRARFESPAPAPAVRLQADMGDSEGVFGLRLERDDGGPLTPADVFNYEVLVSNDPLQSTNWTTLDVPMVLTNGMLRLVDPSTNPGPRFYRVYAR